MKKNFKIISLSIFILIQLILFQYLLRVEPSILVWEITNLYFVIIIILYFKFNFKFNFKFKTIPILLSEL